MENDHADLILIEVTLKTHVIDVRHIKILRNAHSFR